MMEQLDFFEPIRNESWVYEFLLPALKQRLAKSNAGQDCLRLEKWKNYYSVQYLKIDPLVTAKQNKRLVFRIRCQKEEHYFGVSNIFLCYAPTELLATSTPSKDGAGFTNFPFEPTEAGVKTYADFLADVLDEITYSFPNDFDCCCRVEQCSDARQCIHPNSALAVGCSYRKVLRSGRIFYGKNRNVEG